MQDVRLYLYVFATIIPPDDIAFPFLYIYII